MENQVVTLASLIKEHQDKTGDSFAAMAVKFGLSKAKIGQLAQGGPGQAHMPRQETLEKIARGLGLPMSTVQKAALLSAGLMPAEMQDPARSELAAVVASARLRQVVATLDALDDRDLETVRLLAESLTKRQQVAVHN